MANEVRIRASVDDKVSGPLGKIKDKFDQLGKAGGFKALTQGVGVGIGAAAYNAFNQAISGAVGFLEDAVHAAAEDEQSIAKLTGSLKANVPAWDGQTTAIEKTIAARMRLGFSDEEQRDSLAKTVAATHDINEALAVQSTAMDLARFKGISLSEATDALTKVEAGSYRVLKSLGIQLKDGASQTEALAAVQRVANGQAEKFASTNGGKLLASQIKVNEAMERLGYKILPAVADAMGTLADAAGPVIDGLGNILGTIVDVDAAVQKFSFTGKEAAQSTDFLGDRTTGLGQALHGLADGLSGIVADQAVFLGLTTKQQQALDSLSGSVDDSKGSMTEYQGGVTKVAGATAQFSEENRKARKSIYELRDAARDAANGFIDDYYDPLIAADNLLKNKREANDLQRVLSSKKAHSREKHDAEARLHEIQKDNLGLKVALAEAGKLNAKDLAATISTLKDHLKTAKGQARTQIQGIIDKLLELQRMSNIKVTFHAELATSKGSEKKGQKQYASGGYVAPGKEVTVGEEGIEKLTMFAGGGGYVTPNHKLFKRGAGMSIPMGGGKGGVIVNLNLVGMAYPPTPAQQRQMAQTFGPALADELARRGLVSRTR